MFQIQQQDTNFYLFICIPVVKKKKKEIFVRGLQYLSAVIFLAVRLFLKSNDIRHTQRFFTENQTIRNKISRKMVIISHFVFRVVRKNVLLYSDTNKSVLRV